jgi:hypothetical protein
MPLFCFIACFQGDLPGPPMATTLTFQGEKDKNPV